MAELIMINDQYIRALPFGLFEAAALAAARRPLEASYHGSGRDSA